MSHDVNSKEASYANLLLLTIFTLLYRENKRSLLEEGNIMASLNHERVVKLLGVIMEERDCSLVMELLPRGNLLVMLETVSRFNSHTEKGNSHNYYL